VAAERHPEAIAKIMAKLRKGKSKHREACAQDLHWEYSYCISVQSGSLADLIAEKLAALSSRTSTKR